MKLLNLKVLYQLNGKLHFHEVSVWEVVGVWSLIAQAAKLSMGLTVGRSSSQQL